MIGRTLMMAFQTLGVVYGDLGTSPLYVFSDVFSKVSIDSEVDVLGALSVVMYTIALLPLAKYVFVVLKANDNGEGKQNRHWLAIFLHLSCKPQISLIDCHYNDCRRNICSVFPDLQIRQRQ